MTKAHTLAKLSSRWHLIRTFVMIAAVPATFLALLWMGLDDQTRGAEEIQPNVDESFISQFVSTFPAKVPRGGRFAVLPMTDPDGTTTYLGRYFTDLLAAEITTILGDSYDLIDRESSETLRELAMWSWSGEANTETSPKLARLLAPTMLVTGTTFATENDIAMALKLVDIETGLVLSQASGTFALTATTEGIAAKDLSNGSPCLRAVTEAVQENYKWLWAAVLVPFLAWFWKERKTLLAWLRRKQKGTHGAVDDERSECSGSEH